MTDATAMAPRTIAQKPAFLQWLSLVMAASVGAIVGAAILYAMFRHELYGVIFLHNTGCAG